jgi:sulfur-oxidizing protein SoxA
LTGRVIPGLRPLLCSLALAGFAVTLFAADAAPPAGRRSGYDFMGRETRAMQDDDAANPATLWIFDGEALWKRRAGTAAKSCADCHGDAAASMKGVAARHPAPDASGKMLLNLEQRINVCRTERQQAPALAYESRDLLAITAYVGRQSRGMPVEPGKDALTTRAVDAGRLAYNRRQGQLNLSCAQCHDDNAGRKLAGTPIPQAHPTGYPLYRLEWQGVGSLQRRLRNCLTGTRAENLPFGSAELVDLEAFLMWRARGMPLETPAVRP